MSIVNLSMKNSKYQGLTERGKLATHAWEVTFPASVTTAQTIDIDSDSLGGVMLAILVDCTLTAKNYNTKLQCSLDQVTWTDIKHKDLAGSETAAGNFAIAATNKKNMIVTLADYPLIMSQRSFRLTMAPAVAPDVAEKVTVHMLLK